MCILKLMYVINHDSERNLQLRAWLHDITQNRKSILHQYIGDLAHIRKGQFHAFQNINVLKIGTK